jgi:hypothetical protein
LRYQIAFANQLAAGIPRNLARQMRRARLALDDRMGKSEGR